MSKIALISDNNKLKKGEFFTIYPWQSEVERIVHTAVTDAVQGYFKHGDGARAVRKSVEAGLNSAIGFPAVDQRP